MNDLTRRMAKGDERAFAECYDAFADRLYRYLLVRLRSSDDAADALQSVFVRLVQYRRRLRNVRNLTTYLFRMAQNEVHRYQKFRGVKTDSVPSLDAFGSPPAGVSLETIEAANAALSRLDQAARDVVELKIYASCTFQEIAAILDIPQGTAATRYRQALIQLREWFVRERLL